MDLPGEREGSTRASVVHGEAKYGSEGFINIAVFSSHRYGAHLKMWKLRHRKIKHICRDHCHFGALAGSASARRLGVELERQPSVQGSMALAIPTWRSLRFCPVGLTALPSSGSTSPPS